jgi:hypothetical protein
VEVVKRGVALGPQNEEVVQRDDSLVFYDDEVGQRDVYLVLGIDELGELDVSSGYKTGDAAASICNASTSAR